MSEDFTAAQKRELGKELFQNSDGDSKKRSDGIISESEAEEIRRLKANVRFEV